MLRHCWIIAGLTLVTGPGYGDSVNGYVQTNLTSDLPGLAANQDPNLVNPWGLVAGPTTPFWTSDNGTGLATIYPGSGKPASLVVTIPAAPGSDSGDPNGIVFNTGSAAGNFAKSSFIFANESGSIAAWSGGATAVTEATGAAGSIYKGLAINTNGTMLYAANFGKNQIDVFDGGFNPVTLATTAFKDPNLPSGYAPFNVQNIGGLLYVTYAATNGGRDETDGPGLGFVDVYDSNGTFQKRLVSQGALNAPWGLALAPATGFGTLSGDLLVGNFGDGAIDAYNQTSGKFESALTDANGNPIMIPGLWGISFGNGSQGTSQDALYFNAGVPTPGGSDVESHGLFGELTPAPEPGSMILLGGGLVVAAVARRTLHRRKRSASNLRA